MLLGNPSFWEEHKGKMTFCPGSAGPGSGPDALYGLQKDNRAMTPEGESLGETPGPPVLLAGLALLTQPRS